MTKDDILDMNPGSDMDKAIGKLIGAAPEIKWYAMNKEETAYYLSFDSKSQAEGWHNNRAWSSPNSTYAEDGGHIVRKEIYRQYSADVSEAMGVAEKLSLDGWEYSLNRYNRDSARFEFCLLNIGKRIPVWSNNIPEAICKAALIATMVVES